MKRLVMLSAVLLISFAFQAQVLRPETESAGERPLKTSPNCIESGFMDIRIQPVDMFALPLQIVLTDPQGRQAGEIAPNAKVTTIPNSYFDIFGPDPDEGDKPGPDVATMEVCGPAAGLHHLKITAAKDSRFMLTVVGQDASRQKSRWTSPATALTSGQTKDYAIEFSAQPGAKIKIQTAE